jgi:hypothetical protein
LKKIFKEAVGRRFNPDTPLEIRSFKMSWETDYDKEHDAEMKKYREELYADYREQFCSPEMGGDDPEYPYITWLIGRMFWEGNPAKEPTIDCKHDWSKLKCSKCGISKEK